MIQPISFKRHRFPADVIRQAVWLYFRFTLSIGDVEGWFEPPEWRCCQSNRRLGLAHDLSPLSQGG
jgi:hypothetical protein